MGKGWTTQCSETDKRSNLLNAATFLVVFVVLLQDGSAFHMGAVGPSLGRSRITTSNLVRLRHMTRVPLRRQPLSEPASYDNLKSLSGLKKRTGVAVRFKQSLADAATFSTDQLDLSAYINKISNGVSEKMIGGTLAIVALIQLSKGLVLFSPPGTNLMAHAVAGALGGIVALSVGYPLEAVERGQKKMGEFGSIFNRMQNVFRSRVTDLYKGFRKSMVVTAITRAVNAGTYAYLKGTLSLSSISGGLGVVAVAAFGTGIMSTLISLLFDPASSERKMNLAHKLMDAGKRCLSNIVGFEVFFLSYTALCVMNPILSISLGGAAISGALCGSASYVASASLEGVMDGKGVVPHNGVRRRGGVVDSIKFALKRTGSVLQETISHCRRSDVCSLVALSNAVLFVVYQAVYEILV
ncbi:hypothetical protein GUITHDRAFT_166647 [Guillardia theta CCMP2712]|uniref:Uncharacterized protein n=1 Tax=Guillardia theta (strain CCMP2712) TaxID=905079 RepID=L1IA26_GUITC|nr:hypothetical protein GUITHDRAFT_166647 [Guillardia theta CCMP2712]EKX32700.1 hypothetical protein GUITHDRAFT_166647 [Guillardia theta CCMP2712]|eukprot:XP_005819680.1 hypothetical protein GUITHDRAFT_166647 [Guillardia theta CCMP2712]